MGVGASSVIQIPCGPILTQTISVRAIESSNTSSPVFLIERLHPSNLAAYREKAFELFAHSFPNPDEREPVEDIIERIERYAQQGGPDADGGEFHAHVFIDRENRVIGYSQGSVMPCGKVRRDLKKKYQTSSYLEH